jgi:hypothetical protein
VSVWLLTLWCVVRPRFAVLEARKIVAEITLTGLDEYGLFIPPREDEIGQWLRDDYPLEFYGFEGYYSGAQKLISNSSAVRRQMHIFSSLPRALLSAVIEVRPSDAHLYLCCGRAARVSRVETQAPAAARSPRGRNLHDSVGR